MKVKETDKWLTQWSDGIPFDSFGREAVLQALEAYATHKINEYVGKNMTKCFFCKTLKIKNP